MTTKHPVIEFVAGDDWEIRATCLDENGNAYDLSGSPTIMYLLYDDQHSHIIDSPIITIMGDPKLGNISIIIPSSETAVIAGGTYSDALRLIIQGSVGTLLMGPVSVIANPWGIYATRAAYEEAKVTSFGRRVAS
jgi:hypothetical protein